MNNQLETFLKTQAEQRGPAMDRDWTIYRYQEHMVESANIRNGPDSWLERGEPWIWKVGVIALVDMNKRDWAYVYWGIQETGNKEPEFLGMMQFPHGENTDVGRTLERAFMILKRTDSLFEADR